MQFTEDEFGPAGPLQTVSMRVRQEAIELALCALAENMPSSETVGLAGALRTMMANQTGQTSSRLFPR